MLVTYVMLVTVYLFFVFLFSFLLLFLSLLFFFFFSSRRRHTRCLSDWSSDVCSSDLFLRFAFFAFFALAGVRLAFRSARRRFSFGCVRARAPGAGNCRIASLKSCKIGRASCRERV